jgi:DNA-binding HxlR family transcriptional regulator
MKKLKKRSYCGVSSTLDIIGDKWSLLIIRDILFNHKSTFGDFLNSDEKIATNILTDRLTFLEAEGIILKKEHPDSKAKYLYQLTPKGIDLLPVLMEMVVWSDKYLEISERGKDFARKIRDNKEELIKKITSQLNGADRKME